MLSECGELLFRTLSECGELLFRMLSECGELLFRTLSECGELLFCARSMFSGLSGSLVFGAHHFFSIQVMHGRCMVHYVSAQSSVSVNMGVVLIKCFSSLQGQTVGSK